MFIMLASLNFFEISAFPEAMRKALHMGGAAAIWLLLGFRLIYAPSIMYRHRFKTEVVIILLSVFISMFSAWVFHDQSLKTTLIAQRFMYFFGFYFLLHAFKPDRLFLFRMIFILGSFHALLYIVQYFIFPVRIFDGRAEVDRGTVRIFMEGYDYLLLAYLLALEEFYKQRRLIYVAFLIPFLMVFLLSGTRQTMAIIFLLTIMSVLFSRTLTSKSAVFALMGIAAIPIAYIFKDMFMELILLSKEQKSSAADNVRVRAALFFLAEFFPNRLTYLIGNGVDSMNSIYGKTVQFYKTFLGFYQSDVGIIGDYTKFGVLFIVAEIMAIVKAFASKTGNHLQFINYYFLSVVLTAFISTGTFGSGSSIVVLGILFYLIDQYHHDMYVQDVLTEI